LIFTKLSLKNSGIEKLKRTSYVLFCCFTLQLNAQFYNLPNDYFFSLLTERRLAEKDSSLHCGMKPYIHFYSEKYIAEPDTHRIYKYIFDDPALDVAFFKHVISFEPKGHNAKFIIDPMVNFQRGNEHFNGTERLTYTNTRGLIASAYIGKKVYVETMFSENQSKLPHYLDSFARKNNVIPGQGRWKKFRGEAFDFAYSSGFFSLQLTKNINLQAGHGKHKIGNGYRSLLLSDNCLNYPYARITQQWMKGRLQYTNIYAVLMNLSPASVKYSSLAEPLLQKKPAAFQYLSFNPAKFLNIGLFQGIMWSVGDRNNAFHLDHNYFNPVIYAATAQKGLNDSNNILLGSDIRIKIAKRFSLYGQVMMDDLSNSDKSKNGFGYQAGLCYFNALGIKNLFFQVEYNSVSENSYLSPVTTRYNQSWSHYNQNLAYTPGYGNEFIIITDYKYKRFNFNVKYQYLDVLSAGEYFSNTQSVNLNAGYLVNPAYNLNLTLGYTHRNQNFPNFKGSDNETSHLYLSLRTSLYNIFYDF